MMPESRIDKRSGDAHGVRRGTRSCRTLCAATCGTTAGGEPRETAQFGRLILVQQNFRRLPRLTRASEGGKWPNGSDQRVHTRQQAVYLARMSRGVNMQRLRTPCSATRADWLKAVEPRRFTETLWRVSGESLAPMTGCSNPHLMTSTAMILLDILSVFPTTHNV